MSETDPKKIPKKKARGSLNLRFPVIPKTIEYFEIIKNKVTLKVYRKEIAGLKWRELGEKIFADGIPAGSYSYAIKFEKDTEVENQIFASNTPYRGFIKIVSSNPDVKSIPSNEKEIISLHNELLNIKNSLNKSGSSSGDMDYLLKMSDRLHETQIKIYEKDLESKEKKILKLETEIERLEGEVDKAEETCLKLQSGSNQTKLLEGILNLIPGVNGSTPKGLSDSEIPGEIINILNKVDYTKVFPDVMQGILTHLNNIVNQLPKKGGS